MTFFWLRLCSLSVKRAKKTTRSLLNESMYRNVELIFFFLGRECANGMVWFATKSLLKLNFAFFDRLFRKRFFFVVHVTIFFGIERTKNDNRAKNYTLTSMCSDVVVRRSCKLISVNNFSAVVAYANIYIF